MEIVEVLTIIATIGGLLGNLFLVYKSVNAFYIWIVANSIWIVADVLMGWYTQTVLWGIYIAFAIWSIWEWKKPKARPGIPPGWGEKTMITFNVEGEQVEVIEK